MYTFLKKRVWGTVGIPGRSNPSSTTIGFSFFVLSKGFSSYTYVTHHKIENTDIPSLETITRTAKDLITLHYSWKPEVSLDIGLYWVLFGSKLCSLLSSLTVLQPEEPLQSTKSKVQLMTQLKNTVDDEYLEFHCCKVLTEDDLCDSGKTLNKGLIVIGVSGLTLI